MRKVAIYGAASLLVLTGLTGLAHTRTGLRAIAWVTGSEGCPFGAGEELTAAKAEQLRVEQLAKLTAQVGATAPARPALGFRLGRDQRGDIVRWASAHGVSCQSDRSGAGLRCLDVAFADLPSALAQHSARAGRGVISFGFSSGDRLVSVQLQSATGTAPSLLRELAVPALAELEALAPGATSGDALDSSSFVARRARAVFTDYVAEVAATNLGKRWTLVQSYQLAGERGALAAR